MLTKCDGCGDVFEAVPQDVPAPGGVIREFSCTYCDATYPVCFITTRGKQLERRIKIVREMRNADQTKLNWLLDRYRMEVMEVTEVTSDRT